MVDLCGFSWCVVRGVGGATWPLHLRPQPIIRFSLFNHRGHIVDVNFHYGEHRYEICDPNHISELFDGLIIHRARCDVKLRRVSLFKGDSVPNSLYGTLREVWWKHVTICKHFRVTCIADNQVERFLDLVDRLLPDNIFMGSIWRLTPKWS